MVEWSHSHCYDSIVIVEVTENIFLADIEQPNEYRETESTDGAEWIPVKVAITCTSLTVLPLWSLGETRYVWMKTHKSMWKDSLLIETCIEYFASTLKRRFAPPWVTCLILLECSRAIERWDQLDERTSHFDMFSERTMELIFVSKEWTKWHGRRKLNRC